MVLEIYEERNFTYDVGLLTVVLVLGCTNQAIGGKHRRVNKGIGRPWTWPLKMIEVGRIDTLYRISTIPSTGCISASLTWRFC